MHMAARRDGCRAAATSKMEHFVIIVNGFQPLNIMTKHSILDVAAALDPSLALLTDSFSGVHKKFTECKIRYAFLHTISCISQMI